MFGRRVKFRRKVGREYFDEVWLRGGVSEVSIRFVGFFFVFRSFLFLIVILKRFLF